MRKTEFPIKTIDDLENLGLAVRWQWFEKLVAFVFEQNEFAVEQNKVVVFDKNTKRQYDVVAEKFGKTWLVECKKQKKLNFNEAIRKHLERCEIYTNMVKQENDRKMVHLVSHIVSKETNIPNVSLHDYKTKKTIIPIIVTMYQELEAEIPVVPLLKLNAFINEY